MSDVDDARARREETERTQSQRERELAEQQRRQAELETARQDAVRAAEQNPTPQNIQAAAAATQAVGDQTDQVAEATRARDRALAAANDARLAEVHAIVAAGNAGLHRAKGNPNGILINTDMGFEQISGLDCFRVIQSNFSIRVTGTEQKVALGFFGTFIGGVKDEVVLAKKSSLVVGLDQKRITGAWRRNYAGLKMETIVGAKIERHVGTRFEHHDAAKVYLGPAEKAKHPAKDEKAGTGDEKTGSATDVGKKGQYTSGKKGVESSRVLRDIKSLKNQIFTLRMNARNATINFVSMETQAAKIAFKSSETFVYDAGKGTATLEGGGAKAVLGGTAELVKGGSIKCDGSGVSVNGKTIVN